MENSIHVTEAELVEWQALCGAATPGPWEVVGENGYVRALQPARTVCRVFYSPDEYFIAVSHAAMPRLIAEVRRLQINYDRLESILSGLTYHITDGKLSKIYTLETLQAEYDDAHTKSVNECVDEVMTEIRSELTAANARVVDAERQRDKLLQKTEGCPPHKIGACRACFGLNGFQRSLDKERKIQCWREYAAQKDGAA